VAFSLCPLWFDISRASLNSHYVVTTVNVDYLAGDSDDRGLHRNNAVLPTSLGSTLRFKARVPHETFSIVLKPETPREANV